LHGLSLLESQELNLLDQNGFIGLFLTDSDPVPILGVAFPRGVIIHSVEAWAIP
jgi:hypothetical protein